MIEHYLKRHSNRIVSSYFVLLADVCISIGSFSIAFLLRFNFEVTAIYADYFLYCLGFTVGIRSLFFVLFRSHQGIIRHTSLEDILLLLYAVTAGSTLTALGTYFGWQAGYVVYYVPVSILMIDYCCCLVALSLSRFLVKAFYWHLRSITRGTPLQPILIYGAGKTGLLTRNALAQDPTQRYTVLAFIDDNPYKINKVIQGLPVVSRQEAYQRYVRKQTIPPQILLAMGAISPKKKTEITDFFLQYHVSVKTIPTVEQWIDGRLNSFQIRDIRIEDLLGRSPIQLENQAIREQLNDQVVMVTGAAGSIGAELIRQVLRHRPHTVVLVDQAESALFDLEFKLRREYQTMASEVNVIVKIADISDEFRMRHIFRETRPTIVFHAAAYKHVPLMEEHPYEAVRVNVLGTQIVADLSLKFGVRTFVMISTDKAVNPTNVMGATKRLAEMYVQSLNHPDKALRRTRFIATRFGNVLGSNGSVVTVFQQQIQSGGPVTVTHPDIIRYFMTIPEACQLVLEAGGMGKGGEVFVFDMGDPVKIVELARKMIHLSGYAVDKDIKIVFTGLRPGEKLFEELLNDNESTLPTHHPKIMIAQVVIPDADEMKATLDQLRHLMLNGSDHQLVGTLKRLIPEYISNNSVFTALDY